MTRAFVPPRDGVASSCALQRRCKIALPVTILAAAAVGPMEGGTPCIRPRRKCLKSVTCDALQFTIDAAAFGVSLGSSHP